MPRSRLPATRSNTILSRPGRCDRRPAQATAWRSCAYSPIAKGRVKGDRVLARIGDRYRKTAAQVCLRWLVQQNVSAIPRTSKLERLQENLDDLRFRAVGRGHARDFGDVRRRHTMMPTRNWAFIRP